MIGRRRARACGILLKLFLLLFVVAAAPAQAAEKAWYGFHIKPETTGFPLNPVVVAVVIDKVAPDSPATSQNIRVGDEIVEAEGQAVPGGRALSLLVLLSKPIGATLHLRLKRPNGEAYSAAVIGIRKPIKPSGRSSS